MRQPPSIMWNIFHFDDRASDCLCRSSQVEPPESKQSGIQVRKRDMSICTSCVCLPVCLSPVRLACFTLTHYLSMGFSLALLHCVLSLHLCVYRAHGPDPNRSPRFMKCEQLSRWCISYSGRLRVGFCSTDAGLRYM